MLNLHRLKPNLAPWRRVLLPALVGLAVAGAVLGVAYAVTPTVPSVAVRQVFVDVDQNGTLDLLLYGEVVLNNGPLSASQAQP